MRIVCHRDGEELQPALLLQFLDSGQLLWHQRRVRWIRISFPPQRDHVSTKPIVLAERGEVRQPLKPQRSLGLNSLRSNLDVAQRLLALLIGHQPGGVDNEGWQRVISEEPENSVMDRLENDAERRVHAPLAV